jgi:hypothetical protein
VPRGCSANAAPIAESQPDHDGKQKSAIDAVEQRGQQRTWETAKLEAELAED